jgi:pyridoxal phosphate enzyme (YggS family)
MFCNKSWKKAPSVRCQVHKLVAMIAKNIESIQKKLEAFPGSRLIAVSKTQPVTAIKEAYHAGIRLFGENKVQEMAAKARELPQDINWHMIGHLQSNKVKILAPFAALVHSVDSWKLLLEINKRAEAAGRVVPCLLQIFIAREETKFGLDPDEAWQILEHPELPTLKHISITGLMGMASNTDNLSQVRQEFRGLRQLFEAIQAKNLGENVAFREVSMGMSNDYHIALQEGSTLIRVGSLIFGERNYHAV